MTEPAESRNKRKTQSAVPGTFTSQILPFKSTTSSSQCVSYPAELAIKQFTADGHKSSCCRGRKVFNLRMNDIVQSFSSARTGFHADLLDARSGQRSGTSIGYHDHELIAFFTFHHTETIASLQAFRKRHADAQRLHAQYASQPTAVDFSHYRSILKNQAIVDEAEKLSKDFKPVTYDVNAHIKAIEAFETKAVGGSLVSLRHSL